MLRGPDESTLELTCRQGVNFQPPSTRRPGLGDAYCHKRMAAGDSSTEAPRCLKRRLARVVFNHLHTDHRSRTNPRGSESRRARGT